RSRRASGADRGWGDAAAQVIGPGTLWGRIPACWPIFQSACLGSTVRARPIKNRPAGWNPAPLLCARLLRRCRRRCGGGEEIRGFDFHVEAFLDLVEPFLEALLLDRDKDVALNLLVGLGGELI